MMQFRFQTKCLLVSQTSVLKMSLFTAILQNPGMRDQEMPGHCSLYQPRIIYVWMIGGENVCSLDRLSSKFGKCQGNAGLTRCSSKVCSSDHADPFLMPDQKEGSMTGITTTSGSVSTLISAETILIHIFMIPIT